MPHQAAGGLAQPGGGGAGDRGRGVGGEDAAAVPQMPHHTAGLVILAAGGAGHRAGGVAEPDGAVAFAHQDAQFLAAGGGAGDVGAGHADPGDAAGAGQMAEQPQIVIGVGGDSQVGNGVALAVENGRVGPADGRPVGVARQADVGPQFVAGAGSAGAAHPVAGVGEAAGEGVGVGVLSGVAVAIQVVADGIELRGGSDVDEAVVVGIIVADHGLALRRGAGRGVLAGSAELPGVVGRVVGPATTGPGSRPGRGRRS